MDLEEYYSADERRRRSAEIEFGSEWHDVQGNRYELSWIVDTGELYAMLELSPPIYEGPFGGMRDAQVVDQALVVQPVTVVAEQAEIERALDGWADHMAGDDSFAWVVTRLREAGLDVEGPT